MTSENAIPLPNRVALPDIPALCVFARECALLTEDGEFQTLSHQQTISEINNKTVMVCHAPYTKERLGFEEFYTFDVLELFAFVHPARFCVPTPNGLSRALGLSIPQTLEDQPFSLIEITQSLLTSVQKDLYKDHADPLEIAKLMGRNGKGWAWSPFIISALGHDYNPQEEIISKRALNVWKNLPEWVDDAPPPAPSHHGVDKGEAHEQLNNLLSAGDKQAELRSEQKAYSADMTKMFAPMQEDENPHIVLAEAGTGVGKTLGYLSPASVWAEKNDGTVWISTYTKNLQRQIDGELDRLYPHPVVKDSYVSIRKGRENYLCLLNFEDLAAGAALSHNLRHTIAAGIMARWIVASKDGDLSGASFPGWLSTILGFANSSGLSDRRGECIYSACDHYNRCFIERSVRKAKRSRLVIANHALVMIQSAMAASSETLPTRYIFDEGHHLFDAADSAFAAHLTARETADLRRWIMGAEGGKQKRARGLKRRIEDLIEGDPDAMKALDDIMHHAQSLCAQGWSRRFKDKIPNGPTEQFLMEIYRVVHARAEGVHLPYSLETGLFPIDDGILNTSKALKSALLDLLKPIKSLSKILHQKLVDDQGMLDNDVRKRLDALATSLERRGKMTVQSWIDMLDTLESGEPISNFVDWMEVERIDGKAIDVGTYRHYLDPMKPFASSIRPHLHGMGITSATLRDRTDDEEYNWKTAQERCGAQYLTHTPEQSSYPSPFNYNKCAKVFIVDDVNKNDLDQVASAYRALFTASGGSALGLFTAIQRLRAVHNKIFIPLEEDGIPLYAQHSDTIDTGTLIDMFKEEETACLLGTDAVRDGVDVPGKSLRLLVFDRVPWPRPTILHKARKEAFGKRQYDEMITRFKIKQAFGRLIRHGNDTGVFVMLDSGFPSRLHSAFPDDVEVIKTGLSDICQEIRDFL
ncbi:MAG: ATP-dependent DNA helicase [Alphaproteobacteria bacterium]